MDINAPALRMARDAARGLEQVGHHERLSSDPAGITSPWQPAQACHTRNALLMIAAVELIGSIRYIRSIQAVTDTASLLDLSARMVSGCKATGSRSLLSNAWFCS